MLKLIGKQELCSSDLKKFKAIQGISGRSLFERYESAEGTIINRYIEPNYRHFLAQPIKDGDSIVWYGKKFIETPRLFTELQGDELENYKRLKNDTITHYKERIVFLEQSDKSTEAEFLSEATKYIDDRFIYCYDDKVTLGIWGMQLRDNVREPIGVAVKNIFVAKKATKDETEVITSPPLLPPVDPIPTTNKFNVRFISGENGAINGNSEFSMHGGGIITENQIPQVEPKAGYEFAGWDVDPTNYKVSGDKAFTAQYKERAIPPPPPPRLPWYMRFWHWLKRMWAFLIGRGCLKWLLWLLLLLLLLLLLSWLFRSCRHTGGSVVPIIGGRDSTWVKDDPRSGQGGIYDPGNPYKPIPTPNDPDSGYKNVLPPQQGVLPPIDNPEIIREPGNRAIIGNRLNILMENEDKSIMDLAKAFKQQYPDEKYKVVYYDDVVKRMQIEFPTEERKQLKEEIPGKFTPEYNLFVFDESLFEGSYNPKDPAFSDSDKSWYLRTINAPQAWDITRGSPNLTIAIVDNGFNLSHPELASKIVMPYNVWRHSNEIFPQQVDHGTHVAGIALALADNGKGLCGIAPNCKFMPIQVANSEGLMTTTSVLDGILYSLYQGADVINVSLGSQFDGLNQISKNDQEDIIQNHFKEEERLWREIMRIAANHNSTIVVAAGNNNIFAGIDPLQRPELFITVSAVDKNNANFGKADFSNYGPYSTISAPGVDIFSSIGKNDYRSMDGTSMAAPIISGSIALMKSLNEKITTKQIICILQKTGLPTQGNIGKLIQLDKALEKAKSGELSICDEVPIPSSGDVQVLLSWNNYNDLDLYCTDPSGATVFFKNKRVSSGGQLEIDMNVEYPDAQNPIENIFWNNGTAPNGTYHVYLQYYRNHEPNINETPYSINVKYDGKSEEYTGVIRKEDNFIHICSFTLGDDNNINPNNPDSPEDTQITKLLQERERLEQELERINNELENLKSQHNDQ